MTKNKEVSTSAKSSFNKLGSSKSYDSQELVIPIKLLGTEEEKKRLTFLVNRAAKSQIGRESLQTAADGNFTLSFNHADGIRGCCDDAGKYIQLSPRLNDDKLTSTLIHEARHASQFVNGGNEHFGIDDMKTQLMKMRVMESDAQRAAVVGTWQLAQQGDTSAYEVFAQDRIEIHEKFAKAAEKYGGNSDEASTAAFQGWCDQNGTKTGYERGCIISELKDASKNGKEAEYKFDTKISTTDLVKRTCFKADGSNYYKGDMSVLDKGKYVDITNETKTFVKNWFKERKETHGLKEDKSLDNLPIRTNTFDRRSIVTLVTKKTPKKETFKSGRASVESKKANDNKLIQKSNLIAKKAKTR